MEENKEIKNRRGKLPWIALGLDFAAVAFFFLGVASVAFGGTFIIIVGMLCFLLTVASPLVGIIISIAYLCREKGEQLSGSGVAVSILAIALPIVTIIVILVLFGTGVAVISLM